MNNLGVIDQFLQTFIRYIDGGFGLLNGDVVALTGAGARVHTTAFPMAIPSTTAAPISGTRSASKFRRMSSEMASITSAAASPSATRST